MDRLLIFFIYKRLKSFYSVSNWRALVGLALLALTLMCYALGSGFLYSHFLATDKTQSAINILNSIKMMLILLPALFKFFPAISFKKQLVATNYPISKFKIAILDFIGVCLLKSTNWVFFLFVMVFNQTAIRLGGAESFSLFLYWFCGFLFAENLINAVTWKKYNYLLLVAAVIFVDIALIYGIGWLVLAPNYVFVAQGISTVVLLTSFFGFYESKIIMPVYQYLPHLSRSNLTSKWVIVSKMLFNNERFRFVLLIAIGMKIVMLIVFLSKRQQNSFQEILDKMPFLLLFETPILLFSYLFNNIWGYFWQVQFNALIANGGLKQQVSLFLSLLVPVLLIDFVVALIINLVFKVYEPRLFLLYIIIGLYAIVIGILSSMRKYFFAISDTPFSNFRARTSDLYTCFLIFPVCLICLVFAKKELFFWAISIMLAVTVFIAFFLKNFFQDHYARLKNAFFVSRI